MTSPYRQLSKDLAQLEETYSSKSPAPLVLMIRDLRAARHRARHGISIRPRRGRAIDVEWADVPNAQMLIDLLQSKREKRPTSESA